MGNSWKKENYPKIRTAIEKGELGSVFTVNDVANRFQIARETAKRILAVFPFREVFASSLMKYHSLESRGKLYGLTSYDIELYISENGREERYNHIVKTFGNSVFSILDYKRTKLTHTLFESAMHSFSDRFVTKMGLSAKSNTVVRYYALNTEQGRKNLDKTIKTKEEIIEGYVRRLRGRGLLPFCTISSFLHVGNPMVREIVKHPDIITISAGCKDCTLYCHKDDYDSTVAFKKIYGKKTTIKLINRFRKEFAGRIITSEAALAVHPDSEMILANRSYFYQLRLQENTPGYSAYVNLDDFETFASEIAEFGEPYKEDEIEVECQLLGTFRERYEFLVAKRQRGYYLSNGHFRRFKTDPVRGR